MCIVGGPWRTRVFKDGCGRKEMEEADQLLDSISWNATLGKARRKQCREEKPTVPAIVFV